MVKAKVKVRVKVKAKAGVAVKVEVMVLCKKAREIRADGGLDRYLLPRSICRRILDNIEARQVGQSLGADCGQTRQRVEIQVGKKKQMAAANIQCVR